jgi:hypothetical protein
MADVSSTTRKSFTGSCHCGFVRYEVVLSLPSPPDPPTATRCNCTVCLKTGSTNFRVAPDDFTLQSPPSFNEIPDYQFRSKDTHKYFCKECGIHVCGKGKYEYEGKVFEYFTINILTLDQPQEGLDLSTWKIKYWDGRNDNWKDGMRDVPWSGGCV